LPDATPPSRYRIVERSGRLEVIDLETGTRPASAAERMAAHDAAHGHAALRYDRLEEEAPAPPPAMASGTPAPTAQPRPTDPIRAALARRANPWGGNDGARAELGAQSQSEARARPAPDMARPNVPAERRAERARNAERQPFVTGKWWDSKGPRTISLGAAGQAKLQSSFVTAAVIAFFAIIAMIVVQPALLLVAAFALFRFGGTIVGPIGAWLIDDAIKADGGLG
jgi:hypothetical protein